MGIPMGQWSGSDATEALRKTIIDLANKTDRQTKVMIGLTVAIAVMTLALLGLTVVMLMRMPS